MKPKTKLQKKIVELSKNVVPASEDDKNWANEALFDTYFVECRNRYNCLECGHKWNPDCAKLSKYILPATCPNCEESNLLHIDGWNTDESKYAYWAIIDVVEGFQVVRMFFSEKYLKRKQPARYYHHEVMQHWIRGDGKITSLTLAVNCMGSYYYDAWLKDSDLEVRTKSGNHRLRCSIAPYKIRPGRKILSIIRRNGYKGYFYGEAPHQFFSAILKHQKAETLLKAGQKSLFKKYIGLQEDRCEQIERHWRSICIAIRNNYIVEDASLWLDYLDMLERFNKDRLNAHYICPDDLNKEHDRYIEKVRIIRERQRLEEKKKKIKEENPKYIERREMFFGLCFTANNLTIVPLKSVKEFLSEGNKLNHCIFSNSYYKKERLLILSARMDGEPIETVSVNLNKLKVTQSRGRHNKKTKYHNMIVDTVTQNMDKISKIEHKRKLAS